MAPTDQISTMIFQWSSNRLVRFLLVSFLFPSSSFFIVFIAGHKKKKKRKETKRKERGINARQRNNMDDVRK
jgi:hypothetical protein